RSLRRGFHIEIREGAARRDSYCPRHLRDRVPGSRGRDRSDEPPRRGHFPEGPHAPKDRGGRIPWCAESAALRRDDRHRGGGHPPTPATPPYVRVRIRRFETVMPTLPRITTAALRRSRRFRRSRCSDFDLPANAASVRRNEARHV